MKDNKPDIFQEAMQNSLDQFKNREEDEICVANIDTDVEEIDSQEELAIIHTEEGDKWDNLSEYMTGEGADRLLKELKAMSGRDFVRNYQKLLEHFKPKLTRSDRRPEDEADKNITIEIMQITPEGEVRTLKLGKNDEQL